VSQKKVLSTWLDLALIIGGCLDSLCNPAIVGSSTEGIQTDTLNQC